MNVTLELIVLIYGNVFCIHNYVFFECMCVSVCIPSGGGLYVILLGKFVEGLIL